MGQHSFELPETGMRAFTSAFDLASTWAREHGWETGVAEMALGGALLAWGVESGAIELGQQLVASLFDDGVVEGMLGGATGTALGALPGMIVKSIGIVGMGSAIGVPALVLMGGGALIMGLAGYGAGRLVADYLHQAPALAELAGPGFLVLVGTALLLDGARRISNDPDVQAGVSRFTDGVLDLATLGKVRLLGTKDALVAYLHGEISALATALKGSPAGAAAAAAGIGVGAAAGGAVAASSVTVLGSSTLGGLALSLGMVSAPLWPVLAGAGAAALAAYGAWKLIQDRPDQPYAAREPLSLSHMEPLRLT